MKLRPYRAVFLRYWGTLGSVSAETLPQEKILKTLTTHFLIAACAGRMCASGLFATKFPSTSPIFSALAKAGLLIRA